MKTVAKSLITEKTKNLILVILIALTSYSSYSQKSYIDKATIGIGAGMDYGGIGGNILYYPQNNIGLFAGLGYNFNGIGYNVGTKIRLINAKHPTKASPYVMGMYGYNTVIAVQNLSKFNKVFYGPSFGLGLDYKSSKSNDHYWTFALLFPIRGTEVDNYIADLKNNHGVVFKNNLSPVAFSIGYRIILD
jgi:hypothetical protein